MQWEEEKGSGAASAKAWGQAFAARTEMMVGLPGQAVWARRLQRWEVRMAGAPCYRGQMW